MTFPSRFRASANGRRFAFDICGAGTGGDDRPEPPGLDLVDISRHRDPRWEQRRLDDAAHLLPEIGLEIEEREEPQAAGLCAVLLSDLAADRLVLDGQHSAAGVLDDRELVCAEQVR